LSAKDKLEADLMEDDDEDGEDTQEDKYLTFVDSKCRYSSWAGTGK
jgi:hypothetical protein